MAKDEKQLLAFNRGVVSKLGLGRLDIARMGMSAEKQTNWMPRVLGSMMLRPGLQHIGESRGVGIETLVKPFIFNQNDSAILEFSTNTMRVWVNDALVTHDQTTDDTVIVNGNFSTGIDLGNWVKANEAGATSTISGGWLRMSGTGTNFARTRQEVTISGGDSAKLHSFEVTVIKGPVFLRIGTTAGASDIYSEQELGRGRHQLRFTPGVTTVHFELSSVRNYETQVDFCRIVSSATEFMSIPEAWSGSQQLADMRFSQSGDVIFMTWGFQARRIERRENDQWSVIFYDTENGPFRVENTTEITLTASAISGGGISLTSSKSLFDTGHIGALFRMSSLDQTVIKDITAEDQWSEPIKVIGTGSARNFTYTITGTLVAGTFWQIQRSTLEPGAWVWAGIKGPPTGQGPASFYDGFDEQIMWYRIGVIAGDYGAGQGAMEVKLEYSAGSITGVVRITGITTDVLATADVLDPLGGTAATKFWSEGAWSVFRGFPTAVALYEGRLWWVGSDNIWGSASDAYHDFDDLAEGDSATIARRIGEGPIESIHWLLPAGRLLMGTAENSKNVAPELISQDNPLSIRSSSFGEPLTPTNFNIKDDTARGAFVDRSGQRLYELTSGAKQGSGGLSDYSAEDLSLFAPDFNEVGIDRIAVQIKPDVRIHCVRSDGTAGVLIFDRAENVICWVEVVTDGSITDVAVLPGTVEDQIYYMVNRFIDSSQHYYLEKWAMESEAIGGLLNKQADSFKVYDGSATTTPFGTTDLVHLKDETVVVWADGKDVGEHTVSSAGGITLLVAASKVIAGLGYTAQYKSAKLATLEGVGLNRRRNVRQIGFTLLNTHYQGIKYGPDFTQLSDLPQVEEGLETPVDTIWAEYDQDLTAFGGEWHTDSRICLQASAPRPCQIVTAIAIIET
jgi:hypothetical protein